MNTAVSADGTPIAYDRYGSGPVMIYITGATCHRRFLPIVDDAKEFSKQFTVICYDRRGRGNSGNVLPYAPEREIDDIEALIDAVGGTAVLYGHSSGAVLALEAALRLKTKVPKIAVYDPAYVWDEEERQTFHRLGTAVKERLDRNEHGRALTTFLKGIGMPGVFVSLFPFFPGWKTMKALAPTLVYDIELTRGFAPAERLATIEVPVAVMAGSKSPLSIRNVAETIHHAVSGSAFRVVEGQDHMVSAKVLLPLLVEALNGRQVGHGGSSVAPMNQNERT